MPHQAHNLNNYGRALMSALLQAIAPNSHTNLLNAAYTLYLFSYRQHGLYYSGAYCCSLGYSREFLLLFLHWFPLNFFILKSDAIIFWV
jgi:NADH-ubiquinone oxidoreductase chain 4